MKEISSKDSKFLLMQQEPFDRDIHVFKSPELADLLKNAIRFFNGTPIHKLPPLERFQGSGVYALYYTGVLGIYESISQANRTSYNLPIYVGKAIPAGARRGKGGIEGTSLFKRLSEHANSIEAVDNLNLLDFRCRFIIVPHEEEALIPPIESAIIKEYNPLWNSSVDGFGNHDPGGGRYDQARSPWDVIHPGRTWAKKLKGVKGENDQEDILTTIRVYAEALKKGE